MKNVFTLLFFFIILSNSYAQVVLSPLSSNPELTLQYENGRLKKHLSADKSDNPLHLPFIDDFSKNHQPGAEVVYWEDNFVFINPTYGVVPPTIGVATFEGLDFDGYPYDFSNPTAYGEADVLTSCVINLGQDENGDSYTPGDSIYLSFYYQPQGLGDSPEPQDSLVLEFYDAESDTWIHQWSTAGEPLTSFRLVYIPIVDELYLSPDFQFRFRNYATLSGNLDHWHIDMVWLDKNRSTSEVGFPDVGFQYPVNQLLASYTSMPYSHYQINAQNNMIAQTPAQLVNNNPFAVNLSNVKMLNYNGNVLVNEMPYPGNIENFPAQSSNVYSIPVNEGSADYYFDDAIDQAFVSFNNEFVMTSGSYDLVPDNDTISYVQYLENYYSYDDGSAEAGIGLNVNGGRMITKFQSVVGDSIFAFKIYFNPITNDPVYPFFMVIYDVVNGIPGTLQYIDPNYKEVQYIQEGQDIFAYYFLDSTIYVNGEFFIGIAQTSETSLNIGFDKNIDTQENIFYNLGNSWVQLDDAYSGSLMMRPVFVSAMDSVILGIDPTEQLVTRVFPNPASNEFMIESQSSERINLEIFGIDGRIYHRDQFYNRITVDCNDFSNGIYILRMSSPNGNVSSQKIMVQH
jgi:hypothetical protein